jgi:hypothetical protein
VSPCASPLRLGELVDYWFDELTPAAEATAEEHLMHCDDCGQRLQWITEVGGATRDLIRRGRVPLALTPALLAGLEQDGVRIRRHRVESHGYTHCTAGPDDDLVAVTLQGDFRAGERVDAVYLEGSEVLLGRRTDVPVDTERGEMVLVERGDVVRTLPAQRVRIALYGIGPAGERAIGEYTLLHSPWPGARA